MFERENELAANELAEGGESERQRSLQPESCQRRSDRRQQREGEQHEFDRAGEAFDRKYGQHSSILLAAQEAADGFP
jgi:hypothetical protein